MHFDVCIVGSGPAGALIASTLAPTGKRIAIVEAGGWSDREERTKRLDQGGAEGFLLADTPAHLRIPIAIHSKTQWSYWQTMKVGGNSLVWGGVCPRGLESQFKMRSVHGVGEDWPFHYDELEPFYCRAEEELGVSGEWVPEQPPWRSRPYPLPPIARDFASQEFARACAVLGYSCQALPMARLSQPYRGRTQCNFCTSISCMTCPTTARYASDFTHVRTSLGYPNVTLLTDTIASRLILAENGRVKELMCHLPDRTRLTVSANVFVLACNGIGTARLLLLSAEARHARGLANRSGAVGRYFMGHPAYSFQGQVKRRVAAARATMTAFSRQFEDGPHIAQGAGFRLWFAGADKTATIHGLRLAAEGLYGRRFVQELRRRVGHGVNAWAISDCLPRAENRIELDPLHRDHFGQPGLTVHYDYHEYEEHGRRLASQAVRRIFEVLGGSVTDEMEQDYAHQMGTARMGSDPTSSVVNADLRTHEIDNLYLCGGAVFPNALGPTNPTLTIAALALRLGQHLVQARIV